MAVLVSLAWAALACAQGPPGGGQGDGIWLRNAYYGEAQTFDSCLGHQPGNGQYHHHANPICLRAQLNDNVTVVKAARTGTTYRENAAPWNHSPILGWAYDGYPIYGPYGYSDPMNASSPVQRMRSSFRLRSITQRTTLPDWALPLHANVSQQLNASQYGPAINAQFPLGRYLEDFEYVAGLGDLDVYNGRFAVTPDFPQGTYAYYVTIDAAGTPAFPYVLGGQFYGNVSGGAVSTNPAAVLQDYFVNGAYTGPSSTVPLLGSWYTKNSSQYAQVISAFDPSAGPQTTWPSNVPAGARTSGGVSAPVLADTQRLRYSDTAVYLNANGLASYAMGAWFDPMMSGGVFGNFPSVQNVQVQIPRTPSAAITNKATGLGPVGLWVNGVAVFNVLDGGSYSNATGADVGGGGVAPEPVQVSAASFEGGPVAPGSLVTAFPLFGAALATSTAAADSPNWPTALGGATVSVKDSAGTTRAGTISYASPTQINYRLPADLALGYGAVTISAGGASVTANINVVSTYLNLFSVGSTSLAAGYLVRARSGQQSIEQIVQAISNALIAPTPIPIDLGPATDQVYLILFGSGLGQAASATATIAGTGAEVSYAGAQGVYSGLDQINILIPPSLAGSGTVNVIITSGGRPSNAVKVAIK